MTDAVQTPFLTRLLDHAPAHAWVPRGALAAPAHYGDPHGEALAARVAAVMADVSYLEELRVYGAGAGDLMAAACGKDFSQLAPGRSEDVHWRADGGGVRGAGVLSCLGLENFLLRGHDSDLAWFQPAASRFGAEIRDAARGRGLLLVAGPFAWAVLAAAGLEQAAYLKPSEHALYERGETIVGVFRRDVLGAYLVSIPRDRCGELFDVLMRAGRYFGLRLMGETALEILEVEAGLPVPLLDYQPARTPFASEPTPAALGLDVGGETMLAGLELDSDTAAPFAEIIHDGARVGRTMRSCYSPALKRAVALASLKSSGLAPGTAVIVRHCRGEGGDIAAKVAALPFF